MTTETTTNDHYRLACSVLDLVAERHENGDHDTLPQEQQVMDLLHAAANEGYKPALVADAVLASSNDWSTMRITRNGLFVMMLEEAIDAGALTPDDEESWGWIHQAYFANPDADLMLDYERLYDFLMTAAEAGNELIKPVHFLWRQRAMLSHCHVLQAEKGKAHALQLAHIAADS